MDFTFTDEQVVLRNGVERLLGQHYSFDHRQKLLATGQSSSHVWRQLAEFGVTALPLPAGAGGLDGSVADMVAFADLFGRRLLVEPYLSAVVLCGRALALAPANPRAFAMLVQIADGDATCAFAHEEGIGVARLDQLETRLEADRLTGGKRLVLGAAEASMLVVTVRTGEAFALVMVDPAAPGVTIAPYRTVDGRSAAEVRFDAVAITPDAVLTNDCAAIQRLIGEALIVLCAEAVGAMEALLEQSSAYAATRQQFGVPIAKFQAIAHRLADMKIACVKARATLIYTTALAEAGKATARDASLLKAQVGRLGRSVGESAVQVHGGVGLTDELAVGHLFKRILTIEAMFGNTNFHLRQLGQNS